jgi:small subunit ribosomal protein S14
MIQRNLRRIKLHDQYGEKRNKLKSVINNKNVPIGETFAAQNKLIKKMSRNSSQTRIINRCALRGRPKGVYRI